MARPILIDTDMGVDDAVAIALALASKDLDVVGIASVGGNVSLDQATINVQRLLGALAPDDKPRVARGYDQADADLPDASHVFGPDGFGGAAMAPAEDVTVEPVETLYEELVKRYADDLIIVAIGPLTNLAAVHRRNPKLLSAVSRIVVMGGAVWCKGNVTSTAEFNFYRDPAAASEILQLEVPITLVPLDVTRQVAVDESHVAHLAASGTRTGEVLGRLLPYPIEHATGAETGRFLVHDALAVGALLWPELFMQTALAVDVRTTDKDRGRCLPLVGQHAERPPSILISVRTVDFLDNLLETLCLERFVV